MAEFEFTFKLQDKHKASLILWFIDWIDNMDHYDTLDQISEFDDEFSYLLDLLSDHLLGSGDELDPFWFIAYKCDYLSDKTIEKSIKKFEEWAKTLKALMAIPANKQGRIRWAIRTDRISHIDKGQIDEFIAGLD